MTGPEAFLALAALEVQATELAVDMVRNIAEIRARLMIMQEIIDTSADHEWSEAG